MHKITLKVNLYQKKLGKKIIVDDISFDIKEGEILDYLGPNGAGKTAAVRIIVNLINRTRGTVTINGHNSSTNHLSSAIANRGNRRSP